MIELNLKNMVIGFLLLIILSKVYQKIKRSDEERDNNYYNQMIKQYLFDENLGIDDRPCLWIHIHTDSYTIPEYNSRHWLSFGSRNTNLLNMPYQYLTVRSIIEKNKHDFNILIINDESFEKLIPNWSLNLYQIPIPLRIRIREIALCTLLFIHGGLLVPSSFICAKSLLPIYNMYTIDNKMFVGAFRNNVSNPELTHNSIPKTDLMGCRPKCECLRDLINICQENQSKDFTAESEFKGVISAWLQKEINLDRINLIDGRMIGTLKNNKTEVWIEELISSSYINLFDERLGTYIPWDDLLNRSTLGWFVRMSPEQVLNSDTMVGKIIIADQ